MANDYGPSLTACRLWRKTSGKGTDYFVGRLGGLRLTILPNRDFKDDGDATHVLLLSEAQPYDATRSQASAGASRGESGSGDGRHYNNAPRDQSLPLGAGRGRGHAQRSGPRTQMDDDPVPF